jgi:Lrp/AsnC family leucine-responsive transcriptional regulator
MKLSLDEIDLKILKRLQENGKITNLQLSKEIGLSPAPTLERVKKLEKSGLIKSYHALVDEKELGINITIFMQISLVRQMSDAIDNFIQKITQIDEVVECYNVTGSADYLLKIMVKDIPSFDKLIKEKLGAIEEISKMQSMVVLSKTKDSKIVPYDY